MLSLVLCLLAGVVVYIVVKDIKDKAVTVVENVKTDVEKIVDPSKDSTPPSAPAV